MLAAFRCSARELRKHVRKPWQEAQPSPMCGFIGVYGPDGVDVAPELYEGLLAIQHRGQDAAGIITFTDTFHIKKGAGLVRDAFSPDDMVRLRGNLGLGHVRY